MRQVAIAKLILALGFTSTVGVAQAQVWFPYAFTTNATGITNARTVVAAILAGDVQSRSNIHTLIGSPVVFAGWGGAGWSPTNVILEMRSNIVVEAEVPAPDKFRPGSNGWLAMVDGTLKSVDFQKRVIYVRSRPRGVVELCGK